MPYSGCSTKLFLYLYVKFIKINVDTITNAFIRFGNRPI